MPELSLDNVCKSFAGSPVIRSFSVTIPDGEFLVLLGPSGCGKSTLLRMIAGITEITSGELRFDGQRANDWAPRRRGVAFVFQSYALYPHMTVRGNIAFPLLMDSFRPWYHLPLINTIARRRLMRSRKIAEPTERIAAGLELTAVLDRKPASLSGGQRQRVALARALVRDPVLYLLDEPLSNLDAKLRTQTRAEIAALHRKVGKTFIYVTHDQVEAMTMATRIIVMDRGVIQQIDTPDGIYDNPANLFVAGFVGSPPMNLIPVSNAARQLILGIRPEKFLLRPAGAGRIAATVAVIERLGADTIIGCRRPGTPDLVYVRQPDRPAMAIDEPCALDYHPADIVWFDAITGLRTAV